MLDVVGATPVLQLARIARGGAAIYLKLENQNPSGSAKDRLARHLRSAYLCGRPDGERSFVAVALSCRGVVPR